jgi:hypothetical protein
MYWRICMRAKGDSKRVIKPNFWEGFEEKVSNELKNMIYEQYLSSDLFVYCDASQKRDIGSSWSHAHPFKLHQLS